MAEPHLVCRICGVEIMLSDDPTVRMAEVATFWAAHKDHEEGVGVEATFPLDDGDEEAG